MIASFVERFIRIRAGEYRLVVIMGLLLFVNSLALEISDVVAVSGFLENVGLNELLIVYIIDMLLIIFTAGLQSLVVDRFQRLSVIRGMAIIIAAAYVVLRLMFIFGVPDWLNYSLLYLLSDQQWLFFPLIFWVLANDVFDMAQGKRLFPLIAGVGFIGQIVGLLIAGALTPLLVEVGIQSVEFLSFNALLYILTFFLIVLGLRDVRLRQSKASHEHTPLRETLTEGWAFVREVPSFRFLMLSLLAISMTLVIFEFQFLSATSASFEGSAFQSFYSFFRLGTTFLAFIMQSFITGRILSHINLKNCFLITPVVTVIGGVLILLIPGVAGAVIGFGLAKLAKTTIDESTRTSLLALVPEERRGRVSMFMDSYLFAVGVIAGCVLLGGTIIVASSLAITIDAFYLGIIAATLAAAFAVWAIVRMRSVYEMSLFSPLLKRRQRRSRVVERLEF